MALHEGTEFVNGEVKDRNLDTYTRLRIGDVSELDVHLIDSVEAPVGIGEPGTTVVAPVIGNAIFAAVGVRLRRLAMRSGASASGIEKLGNTRRSGDDFHLRLPRAAGDNAGSPSFSAIFEPLLRPVQDRCKASAVRLRGSHGCGLLPQGGSPSAQSGAATA